MLAAELLDHWPQSGWAGRRLLVGVSGGADSVSLLLALSQLAAAGDLIAAHFNHGWRGAESDQDETFVVELCARLKRKCILRSTLAADLTKRNVASQNDSKVCREIAMHAKGSTLASEGELGTRSEESARAERYKFFKEAAYTIGASYIVTAHTADDRIETLLHNILRGSGLSGAASLRMFRPFDQDLVLVRPLLAKSREDVLRYLIAQGETYRQDSSNRQLQYKRNYIRQQLLPEIRSRYHDCDASLLRFSELAEEALSDIQLLAQQWLDKVAAERAARAEIYLPIWSATSFWVLPRGAARGQVWTVLREALRQVWLRSGWPQADMTRDHWQCLRDILLSTSSSASTSQMNSLERQTLAVLPGDLRVESWGDFLAIGRRSEIRQ